MTCHLMNLPKQVSQSVQHSDQENELVVEPEEDVIDIDDSTAADDYLHSVKKWLQTQERKITPRRIIQAFGLVPERPLTSSVTDCSVQHGGSVRCHYSIFTLDPMVSKRLIPAFEAKRRDWTELVSNDEDLEQRLTSQG